MKRVFVDSAGWIASSNDRDRRHPEASAHMRALVRGRVPLLTTNYVIDECATRLRYDVGVSAALRLRDSLNRAEARGQLEVRWIDRRIESEGWDLLQRYADVRLSLTDAISAVVARRARIREVFTFDDDFRALGFDVRP